ncbi:WD40 repeat domain-containing protein [uncultured Thiodictyon sp.]|uniref:WD40 repeat domain-containing protein n=1 Tax=uncultured Thiodictyon sp. TaxID=1846217 RepID=UPI0025D998D9|nr:WD40 repeat domain-containing protein [uncultured Thiodictyon sp.]
MIKAVDAVEACAQHTGPEVLVYKKTTPRLIDITNAAATHEAVADRERLEAFFRTHFFNPDGSFRRAFRQFDSDRALRELVEGQLRKLLNRRISVERGQRPGAGEWRDNPFRAGRPYALSDEPVFVGRETETRELVARLEAQRADGRGLILITGPAGVGKSSLVYAGLLPRLLRPFLFTGVAGTRWCRLACTGPDPIADLAQALRLPAMLGTALDGFGLDQAGLQRLLETEPAVAAGQVQAALARLLGEAGQAADGAAGRQQLALIIDPLDGLCDASALAAPRTQTFAAALAALAAQDGVWVIATLRSDRLRQLPRLPALAALLDGHSWYPLEPPPPARIRQVIEIPARIAGIEYEGEGVGAGRGLVELLEAEASHLSHWPTLLEPVLAELYTQASAPAAGAVGVPEGADPAARLRLRISDYRALGGVAGTTRRRAEALWESLDGPTRTALPILCRALIALESGASAHPSPRAGDLRALERDPDCARLVAALIAARLIVAEGVADPAERLPCAQPEDRLLDALARLARETREEWRARLTPGRAAEAVARGAVALAAPAAGPATDGAAPATEWRDFRPTACFIHQTLIDAWTPVREWVADPANRRELQLRFQIARQARLWKHTDCNREYLLGELGFAAARRFATAFPGELEPIELEFLDRSHAQLRHQRRRNRLARITGLTLAALLLVASTSAYWARKSSRAATLNLHRSEINAANLAIIQGNTPVAVRLALDAGRDLPQDAVDTLSRAFSANRLIAMVQAGGSTPERSRSPGISDDGNQLVTLSSRDGAGLWNLTDSRFVFDRQLAPPTLPIHAVRFAGGSDGTTRFLGLGETGVWRLPAAAGAAPDWPCGVQPGEPIAQDDAHRYLAIPHAVAGDGFGLCVLDLAHPGPPLWDLPVHKREIRGLSFAPDGTQLITASRDGTARILATATGAERLTLNPTAPQHRPVNHAIFDSKGKQVAVATTDEKVRVYALDGTERITLGEVSHEGRRIRIHQSPVRDLTFAVNDRYLLAGDDEGQLVRWDLATGAADILGQHRLGVERIRVSPVNDPRADDPLVLTASLDQTARLWGIRSGRELAVFPHEAPITNARFSSDGSRILTYSDQDGSVRVWSVGHATALAFRLPHDDHVSSLDVARPPKALDTDPNAFLIASASFDGLVQVWRYDAAAPWAAPGEIWRLVGHRGRVRRVAFSPSARQLASAAYDGSARVWDLIDGGGCALEPVAEASPPAPAGAVAAPPIEFYRVVFAPTERWLLTTSNDPARPVRLWDPTACRELRLPRALEHDGTKVQAADAVATADGTQLAATGNETGTLRVAAQAPDGTWRLRCQLQPHQGAITDLAFAPDGGRVATVSGDGQLVLVTLTGEQCGEPLLRKSGAGNLYSVRFAPDGTALVTASMNGRAQVWDTSGTLLAELKGHKDRVASAEFSPDGRWLLTAARDGAVRLWQRPAARPPGPGRAPTEGSYLVMESDLGAARIARFSPDGRSVAVAYRQDAVVLWRVWTEDPTPDAVLAARWGAQRSGLALIREAARFRRDNGLDAPVAGDDEAAP